MHNTFSLWRIQELSFSCGCIAWTRISLLCSTRTSQMNDQGRRRFLWDDVSEECEAGAEPGGCRSNTRTQKPLWSRTPSCHKDAVLPSVSAMSFKRAFELVRRHLIQLRVRRMFLNDVDGNSDNCNFRNTFGYTSYLTKKCLIGNSLRPKQCVTHLHLHNITGRVASKMF